MKAADGRTTTRNMAQRGRGRLGRALATAAAIAAIFATAPAAADAGNVAEFAENLRLSVFGLTMDQRLINFRVVVPQLSREIGKLTGFQGGDTALIGMDFRVQDGRLYGVGNSGGIYTIDTNSAVLTLISRLTVPLAGTSWGVDFNPAANALRIISDSGQNLRHPFSGPQANVTQTDDPLDYPPATPVNTPGPTANAQNNAALTGAAYTNNDLDPNTGTTLFDIDAIRNQVVIQSPPNNGSLVPTGSLTVDPGTPVGFDIYTKVQNGKAVGNSGFASLVVDGVPGLYSVNLVTGKATLMDNLSEQVVDIAIPLNQ
ncbi:MAG: DUF4394 domain-containing protein [Defluviicoccus sp.]|nr:DUF4394 domain-containing protein [Defluviicoccus sp.]